MNQKVYFEQTPNPATLKFVLGRVVTDTGFECTSVEETDSSPLAAKLFGFPWTSSVYIGKDFITVTKQDWVDWNVLAQPLCNLIQEHLNQDLPVAISARESSKATDTEDSSLVQQIKRILDKEIRPVLQLDGGDIQFVGIEASTLYVRFKGACSGCPSSSATLKHGVETRIKEVFSEISQVVAV